MLNGLKLFMTFPKAWTVRLAPNKTGLLELNLKYQYINNSGWNRLYKLRCFEIKYTEVYSTFYKQCFSLCCQLDVSTYNRWCCLKSSQLSVNLSRFLCVKAHDFNMFEEQQPYSTLKAMPLYWSCSP